jgi:hypothetical protein
VCGRRQRQGLARARPANRCQALGPLERLATGARSAELLGLGSRCAEGWTGRNCRRAACC